MKIIWAIGLFAAGQCSTVTSTYAGQFIMEGFTKINLKRWIRIIITRSISIIPCVIVALSSYNSIDKLTFWCNIIQAIQLPFALLPILHFTSSKRIMGPFRVKMPLKLICYLITVCVIGINVYFSLSLIVSSFMLNFCFG
jgi:natural resistance-associated macrophage protein 2